MGKESKEVSNGSQWTLILPVGALTLLGALMLSVSNEAAIGLKLAEQHGASILLLREDIRLLRVDMKEGVHDTYTSEDAERDFKYIRREIGELKQVIREAHNDT